jgi:glycosyltransferase involved in cell wall biosynthesis
MHLAEIVPTILTFNEEANIAPLLDSLSWAHTIIVVDSGSTDTTGKIASEYQNVCWHERSFDTHGGQWRHAIESASQFGNWILRLDADYELPPDFPNMLENLHPGESTSAYWADFDFVIHGHRLRYSMFPGNLVLFRSNCVEIRDEGHTERIKPRTGSTELLSVRLAHHDRKPLGRFFESQKRYAHLEADLLVKGPPRQLSRMGRLRRTCLVPLLIPLWLLIGKGLILDGRAGMHYVLQRVVAESMIALAVLDMRLRGS